MTDTTLLGQGVSPDANAPADAPVTEAPVETTPVQVEIVDKPKLSDRDNAEESAAKFQRARRDEALKANAEPRADDNDGRARDEKGRFAPRDEKAATGGADGAESPSTASQQTAPPDEPKYRIKVNGREAELPVSELIKRAQLADSANERFQQAAQLYKQAQAIAQSQNPARQPAGPANPTPQGADLAADLARKLAYGTEADAREAINAILARASSSVDPNQLAMQAAQAAMTQIATQSAIEKIGSEYPDIRSDPALTHIANLYWNQVAARDAQQGIQRNPYTVMKEAADLTMGWIAQKKGNPSAASVSADAFAAKSAAKAKAPSAITGTSARASSGAKSPQTQADIVRAERASRGLPV